MSRAAKCLAQAVHLVLAAAFSLSDGKVINGLGLPTEDTNGDPRPAERTRDPLALAREAEDPGSPRFSYSGGASSNAARVASRRRGADAGQTRGASARDRRVVRRSGGVAFVASVGRPRRYSTEVCRSRERRTHATAKKKDQVQTLAPRLLRFAIISGQEQQRADGTENHRCVSSACRAGRRGRGDKSRTATALDPITVVSVSTKKRVWMCPLQPRARPARARTATRQNNTVTARRREPSRRMICGPSHSPPEREEEVKHRGTQRPQRKPEKRLFSKELVLFAFLCASGLWGSSIDYPRLPQRVAHVSCRRAAPRSGLCARGLPQEPLAAARRMARATLA